MRLFDNSHVYAVDDFNAVIQFFAHGKESGCPIKGDINSLQRLRDDINAAIDQLKMREIEKVAAQVLNLEDFRQHG